MMLWIGCGSGLGTLGRIISWGFRVRIHGRRLYDMAVEAMKTGCYFCGCKLVPTKSGDSQCTLPNQVSLDVVNPKHRVLEKGNCRVICCSCNRGRMHMSEADYVAKCLRVVENMMG